MRPVPMRFMGYTWHHNPKELSVICDKTVVKFGVPYFKEMVQSFRSKLCTIKGVGELYGDDCLEQYKKLNEIFEKGEEGVLCLPSLSPMYACFKSLEMLADDKPGVLTYEFSFTQTKSREALTKVNKTVVADGTKTLWDIAYENSVPIENLVQLNPHIMFINDIKKGEVVRLC